ncbi:MAG: choice-of-anchor A family protein [Bacteroidetes bacterium]|nr:choice-of-anchor A family protein [Bacteroidota bacterium]
MRTAINQLKAAILIGIFISGTMFAGNSNGSKDKVKDYTSIAQVSNNYSANGTNISIINPKLNPPARKTYYTGTFRGTLNGNDVKFYCIDLGRYLATGQDYWDEGSTPAEITFILNNYFPYTSNPNALSNLNYEAASVQVAIWHFSDGLDISSVNNNNTVRDRALAIAADASANHNNEKPIQTLVIETTSNSWIVGSTVPFTLKAKDVDGVPVANKTILISSSLGVLSQTSVITNQDGEAFFTLTNNDVGQVTVFATADVQIPHGTRYVHKSNPDGKQKLVLATPEIDTRQTQKTVSFFEQEEQEADLMIEKLVDNSSPDNGNNITYSIKVTNNGPADADNVRVSDVLPQGLEFVSSSVSQGNYDNSIGTWDVGQIENSGYATLTITAKVNLETFEKIDLGAAEEFNLFLFGDLSQPSADTEGRMAIGGNAHLSNYSVGAALSGSGNQDVLIVGGHLEFISGGVYGGNVVYGVSTNLHATYYPVTIFDGTLRQDTPIDFDAAEASLKSLSTDLAGYSATGSTDFEWGNLTLTGNDPFFNVFDLSGDDLSNAYGMTIDVPNGSVVLVNISGDNIDWNGGLFVNGTALSNVLYNVYEANNLKIQGIDIRGSLLAPYANLHFPSGVINGQVIAQSMAGSGQYNSGQFNGTLFNGNVPCDPNITNCAEIIASSVVDPNPDNNSACVEVIVSSDYNDEQTNEDTQDWELVNNLPINEMIWSLGNDSEGRMLAGTIGGKLYTSNDGGETWTVLNESMHVGFIWDIATNQDGDIFLGTEQGIFFSTDDGGNWSGPVGGAYDIRSLVFDNSGNLYAGTWGYGILKSTDNGNEWSAANAGLTNLAIHALTIDANSNLYAGSFGGGVFKSTDLAGSWEKTNIGYDFIWDLDVTSTGNVYAATYGAGVFRTVDNGTTWEQVNSGLDALFTYSVTVDASNNVYVSTWTGGVYFLESGSSFGKRSTGDATATISWSQLGMTSQNVSSLMINKATSVVYAGTKNGTIYKKKQTGVTSVNDLTMPEKFELSQNYPNPFNPSTTIGFSISKEGSYTVKVYNLIGEEIATLLNENLNPGFYNVNFNADNVATGMYIYRLSGDNVNITKKMMLIK